MESSEKVTSKKTLAVMVAIGVVSFGAGLLSYEKYYQEDSSEALGSLETEGCNVLGINLHGDLLTYIPPSGVGGYFEDTDIISSEDILYYIEEAEKDDNIKAILVEADSYGGLPVAGEEVADTLKRLNKLSVAVIRQAGLSAAYWAISSADKIFASINSDVGSIGVTSSYLENINKESKFIELSSGKFKDSPNPDKPITAEERALLMRDVNIVHDNFVKAVSVNRNIPLEKVKIIADGSSVLGERALSLGLIDEIGDVYTAKKYLEAELGEEVEVCWY